MEFIDQLDRKIEINFPPKRIISIVPSQTELLCELGHEDKLVGVTKFCVHPDHIRKSKPVIGGTKNLHIEQIRSLQPDLIIANKEENVKEQIEELEKYFPVWLSDVRNFDDAIVMIKNLGEITDRQELSYKLIQEIEFEKEKYHSDHNIFAIHNFPICIYIIWKNPYMIIGGDTFISSMLELAGFKNLFQDQLRYPEITMEDIQIANPQIVFLSSEPYPFKEKNIKELQEFMPHAKIILIDGEMFSWYGSRLQFSFQYFAELRKQITNTM
ncbi:MAG: ABC transporter substrate-binding protein [Fimbriimonadaceae bacterium]|nr:ABC transporter substrate-binding protein [Chitinophagales bacterium]